ncbi:hypothetical protein HDU76_008886 [Blyttiomyces sp. JEL0837]|nr:hypothetical protein HDU76_008886 [Blyttiomyces sp. JEL0837]
MATAVAAAVNLKRETSLVKKPPTKSDSSTTGAGNSPQKTTTVTRRASASTASNETQIRKASLSGTNITGHAGQARATAGTVPSYSATGTVGLPRKGSASGANITTSSTHTVSSNKSTTSISTLNSSKSTTNSIASSLHTASNASVNPTPGTGSVSQDAPLGASTPPSPKTSNSVSNASITAFNSNTNSTTTSATGILKSSAPPQKIVAASSGASTHITTVKTVKAVTGVSTMKSLYMPTASSQAKSPSTSSNSNNTTSNSTGMKEPSPPSTTSTNTINKSNVSSTSSNIQPRHFPPRLSYNHNSNDPRNNINNPSHVTLTQRRPRTSPVVGSVTVGRVGISNINHVTTTSGGSNNNNEVPVAASITARSTSAGVNRGGAVTSQNSTSTSDKGILRVSSAPTERPKRISFAPDVVGGSGQDSKSSRTGGKPSTSSTSSSTSTLLPSNDFLTALTDPSAADLEFARMSSDEKVQKLLSEKSDLQNTITEQSQRISELEYKLKEAERKEALAVKEKVQAVKELEMNKKLTATDFKSVEQLKSQLHEERTTNAGLIIFNRSLKTQVAELEVIIEGLMQTKNGQGVQSAQAALAKLELEKEKGPRK